VVPEDSADEEEYDKFYAELKILYDVRHWMANWFTMAHSKDSLIFKYFCSCTSDAVFKIVPESKREVETFLTRRSVTPEQWKKYNRRYWRTHCRYFIPGPKRLITDLTEVYDFFKDLHDPQHSRSFFTSKVATIFQREMKYVKR
jgi:hypothetical protein